MIARPGEVPRLRDQTVRMTVANADALKTKRDAFKRYVHALSRAIAWAYSSPDALANYAEIAKVPVELARITRDDFFPKSLVDPDEIHGLDSLMSEAVTLKFVAAPLGKEQVAELIQLQK